MTSALTIAFLYAACAALWILLSDKLVVWLFTDPISILLANTLKGWLFVAVTAVLLHALLRRRTEAAPAGSAPLTGGPSRTLFFLLAVVVLALTALSVSSTLRQTEEKEVARLQTIADLKAQQISNWLKERLGDAEFVQNSEFVADFYRNRLAGGNATREEQLLRRLNQFSDSRGFSSILLLAPDGRLLWDSEQSPARLSANLLRLTQQAARDRKIHQAALDFDAGGNSHLDLIVPLAGFPEAPPVVVLRIDPADWLYPTLESWPVPSLSAESLLFRQEGEQVVFLSELRHRKDAAGRLRFPLTNPDLLATKLLRGEAELGKATTGRDYRDVPVIGVVRAIAGSDLFMITKMDRAELYGEAIRSAIWIGLAGALGLFAVGIGAVVSRQRQQLAAADGIRHSQDERLRSLSLLGAIADASDDAIFAKDRDGRYLLFNRAAEQFTGKAAEDVLGRDDTSLFPAQEAAVVMANDQQVIRDNRQVTFQEEVRTAKGHSVFLATKGPLRDESGKVVGMFGISRDITARKAAEDALRASEKRFQDIVATSADWIWEVDGDWRYTYASDSVLNLLGYTPAEILGKTPFDFMPPAEAERVRSLLAETIDRKQPIRNLENINLCKDGRLCHVLTSGTPIFDANGELIGYRGLDHDITDKKFTELFLRQQAEGLSQRNAELERFNRAMVDREMEMIELKKTVNELSRQLGRKPPHSLAFLASPAASPEEPG